MDKRTILAIVLVVIIITASMVIQTTLFGGDTTAATTTTTAEETTQTTTEVALTEQKPTVKAIDTGNLNRSSEKFTFETDLYEVVFDPVGASISSLMMKEHADADGNHVDIVFNGEYGNNAFLLYWGDDMANPILDTFAYTVSGNRIVFSNDYTTASGQAFTIVKTFEFKDGEYLFAVDVDVIGGEGFTGLNTDGYANKDMIYALFDSFFGSQTPPYGAAVLTVGSSTLEHLTMREARLYTALLLALPVALAICGAVLTLRRKNR